MKKSVIAIISGVVAAIILVAAGFVIFRDSKVVLSNEFYGNGGIGTITTDDLREMIDEKKSFLMFVSQTDCRTAEDFRKVLQEFIVNHPIQIFEIGFSEIRGTGLAGDLKYYPSLVVYREGKVVAYLDANSSDDTAAFQSLDGFEKWLEEKVEL